MNIIETRHLLFAATIALVTNVSFASQAIAAGTTEASKVTVGGNLTIKSNGLGWGSLLVPRDFSVECVPRIGNFQIKAAEISVYMYSDKTPCPRPQYEFYIENALVAPGTYTVNVYKDDVLIRTDTRTFVDVTPERTPVYSLINARTNTYLITADKAERDRLDPAVWKTADAGFTVWSNANNFVTGGFYAPLAPVYRFEIPSKATHFYTISTVDRDFLRTLPSVFVDKGIAFWAIPLAGSFSASDSIRFGSLLCPSVTRPVYRLYNSKRGVHRYTAVSDLVDVMAGGLRYDNLSGFDPAPPGPGQVEDSAWKFEGTAFCVPAS
jgi:hypothetical protein